MDGRPPEVSDAELVARVAGGSEAALAELYDRHGAAVHAAAYRLSGDRTVAEEVVQEAFLALWNRAELFDPTVGSLTAWLLAIARNRSVDRLRAAGRRLRAIPFSAVGGDDVPESTSLERLVAGGELVGAGVPEAGPDDLLAAAERAAAVHAALAGMEDDERRVILLAYRGGLSQSEIAARLGWPLGTVKTRTRRALRRLRAALGDEPEPEAPSPAVETGDA